MDSTRKHLVEDAEKLLAIHGCDVYGGDLGMRLWGMKAFIENLFSTSVNFPENDARSTG